MTRLPIRDELRQMRDEMNQMIDEVFTTTSNLTNTDRNAPQRHNKSYRRPVTNINETDDQYTVTAELPGVNKDNIELRVDRNTVTIHVDEQTKETTENTTKKTRHRFHHQFRTPDNTDIDNAEASYSNGVLEIRLPKTRSDTNNKIEIQ